MDRELRELHRGARDERRRLADTNPHLVTRQCNGCRTSVEMSMGRAEQMDMAGEKPFCEDCRDGDVTEDEYVDRIHCNGCARETPHRSYSNPAAVWRACVVCGEIINE